MDEGELFAAIAEIQIPSYVHEFIRRLNTIALPPNESPIKFPHLSNLLDNLMDKQTVPGAAEKPLMPPSPTNHM